MSFGGLGVAATVREHLAEWSPRSADAGHHGYRTSIRDHLDRELNPRLALDGNGHSVEAHRSSALPDVTVDGAVGILVEPVVSEGGQGRLRTRLDRFGGEYPLLLTVAVEVRDEAAWDDLREAYAAEGGLAIDYAFVAAPEPPDPSSEPVVTGPPTSGERLLSGLEGSLGGLLFVLGGIAAFGIGPVALYRWTHPNSHPAVVEAIGVGLGALAFLSLVLVRAGMVHE